MKFLKTALFVYLALMSFSSFAKQTPTHVLATVHPLALIAASIVPQENLEVLLPVGVSPHDFSLRPSDIDRLQEADIIFWAGHNAEPYLSGFARRWPDKIWIDLSEFADTNQPKDPHYWLSVPIILKAHKALADHLGVSAETFQQQVTQAEAYAKELLEPVRERGFFVFHRAYDHWVMEHSLRQVGAFTLTPEQKPGLKTLRLMREQLKNGDVVCVFREPEYSPALVVSVVGELPVKQGELDPLGTHIRISSDGYPSFLRDMADRAVNCLSPE